MKIRGVRTNYRRKNIFGKWKIYWASAHLEFLDEDGEWKLLPYIVRNIDD